MSEIKPAQSEIKPAKEEPRYFVLSKQVSRAEYDKYVAAMEKAAKKK